jgi:hypothetical protein
MLAPRQTLLPPMSSDDRFEAILLITAALVCIGLVLGIVFVHELAEWLSRLITLMW